jgi:type II secretory pathway predicted ATPase ExeA
MNAVVADSSVAGLHGNAVVLTRAAAAFRETRDPRSMFPHTGAARALDGLLQVADDGSSGCALLTGGPGLGKTLLRSALQQQCASERCVVVTVESGLFDFDDLLLEVLSQLRGERLTSQQLPGRYDRIAELKAVLVGEIAASDRHVVLLLDDAEQYEPAVLEAIGSLLNLSSDRRTFVVPVLVGLPALRHKVARLPALRQRVGAQYVLENLDAVQSAGYVQHRLRMAGLDGAHVFEPSIGGLLHAASAGVPRVLNALCRNALQHALARDLGAVGQESFTTARALLLEAGTTHSPVAIGH